MYPLSDQANSVLDTLRLSLEAFGVTVRTECQVTAITPQPPGFLLTTSAGPLSADKVIVTGRRRGVSQAGGNPRRLSAAPEPGPSLHQAAPVSGPAADRHHLYPRPEGRPGGGRRDPGTGDRRF